MSVTTNTLRQLGYAEGYLTLGMKTDAAEAVAAITGVDREATPVLVMALNVYSERAEWARAAEIGAVLCERAPEASGFWVQWAYATRRRTGIAEAREILIRALGRHPREAVLHFNLACYGAQLGNLNDARELLDTACALDAEFVELTKTDDDLTPLRNENPNKDG